MFNVIEVNKKYIERWDGFIDESINGTIFHRMKFLSYHGSKFDNQEKYLVVQKGNDPWAQISLKIDKSSGIVQANSPYGGSYGGFVFNSYPSYKHGKEALEVFLQYLKDMEVSVFTMTPPIPCCSPYPLDTFYLNLLQQGFRSLKRDISNVLYYSTGVPVSGDISSRARNMCRKAETLGVTSVYCGKIEDFWHLLDLTHRKFDKQPTHTLPELKTLMKSFPKEMMFEVAYKEGLPIAGIFYIVVNPRVVNSFYICKDPDQQQSQGVTLLILKGLERFQKQGFVCFDFGTSSANMVARENLFAFKESFTKWGIFRETFQWVN